MSLHSQRWPLAALVLGAAASIVFIGPVARAEEKKLRVRKSYISLTKDERLLFVEAILKLSKDKRKEFEDMVETHNTSGLGWHRRPAFLPAHRAHLLMFEDTLRGLGDKYKDLTIPYWDWNKDAFPAHLTDLPRREGESVEDWKKRWDAGDFGFMGNDGNPVTKGPFRKGEYEVWIKYPGRDDLALVRQFGGTPKLKFDHLFDSKAFGELMDKAREYDVAPWTHKADITKSFRNKIELYSVGGGNTNVLHDDAHVWIGGHTEDPKRGADEPAFWMLHCNVDRLWAIWECKYGAKYAPEKDGPAEHNLNDIMRQFRDAKKGDQTPKDWLNFLKRGYTYDDPGCKDTKALSKISCDNPNNAYGNMDYDSRGAVVATRRSVDAFEATVVDDVDLPAGTTLAEFHWLTIDDDAFQHTAADVVVYRADGDRPGALLTEVRDVPSTEYATTDVVFGRPIWLNEAQVEITVDSPGTYFVGLRPVTSASSVTSSWLTAPLTGRQAYLRSVDLGFPDWTPVSDARILGFPSDVAWCALKQSADVDPCPGGLLGDSNGDGVLNFGDINCFVAALQGPDPWVGCGTRYERALYLCVNDVNRDALVDFEDIDQFVDCLAKDGCE